MIKIRPIIFYLVLMLGLVNFNSGAQDIGQITASYFKEVRSGKLEPIPLQILLPESATATFALLNPYLNDSASAVRAKAYEITQLASSRSTFRSIRIEGVRTLSHSCGDKNFQNAELGLGYLELFSKNDFSKSAIDDIKHCLTIKSKPLDQLIKLAGFLNLKELIEEIRPYSQPGNSRQIRWATLLSLARMGDSQALQDLMQRVAKIPVNDDVVYKLFPDLIYTRQRQAVDFLIEALNSDEKKCMSADSEKETEIICGYRIMEQLASIIEGYPITLDQSGDLQTNDYTNALATVRQWFDKHKDYTILNDRF